MEGVSIMDTPSDNALEKAGFPFLGGYTLQISSWSLSNPSAQGSGIHAEKKAERLEEEEMVDGSKEAVFWIQQD